MMDGEVWRGHTRTPLLWDIPTTDSHIVCVFVCVCGGDCGGVCGWLCVLRLCVVCRSLCVCVCGVVCVCGCVCVCVCVCVWLVFMCVGFFSLTLVLKKHGLLSIQTLKLELHCSDLVQQTSLLCHCCHFLLLTTTT